MMSLGLEYKNKEHIFDEMEGAVPYLSFPMFRDTGLVTDGFSTRLGGVSEGCFSSLNLSFDREDDRAAVTENFRRMAGPSACAARIWSCLSRPTRPISGS